jgi:hypothetical protein
MNDQIQTEKPANPFLPIALIAVGVIWFLGTNFGSLRDQQKALQGLKDQQAPIVEQSRQVHARFQKMMMDLLALSQTDKDAQTIVAKYGIAVQPQR